MENFNIKRYEEDIRESNRKRGYPGRYHGFKCVSVRYQEKDKEWFITLATPFGEGKIPIGKDGIMEYIYQRFTLFRIVFLEVKLKYMAQIEGRKGCFWRVTIKVMISPWALEYGIPEENGNMYLNIKAVQKLLDDSKMEEDIKVL